MNKTLVFRKRLLGLLAASVLLFATLSLSVWAISSATTDEMPLQVEALSSTSNLSNQAGGVTLTIQPADGPYTEDQAIPVTVTLTNSNYFAVNDIQVQTLLPNGLVFADATMASSTVSLAPKESFEFKGTSVQVDGSATEGTTVAPDLETVLPGNVETDHGTDSEHSDSTAAQKLLLLILLIGGGGTLLFIIIGVIVIVAVTKKIKKKRAAMKALCGLLVCTMLLAAAPANLIASAFDGEDESTVLYETTLDEIETGDEEAEPVPDYVYDTVYILATATIVIDDVTYIVNTVASWSSLRVNVPDDGNSAQTRGEWIALLAERFDIAPMPLTNQTACFYGDSLYSEYGPLAEAFHAFGLLPEPDSEGYTDAEQDIPLFEADRPLTREYAAVTLARTMGYQGEYTMECTDYDQLRYPSEVSVVVMQGLMTLSEDGSFGPEANFTEANKTQSCAQLDLIEKTEENAAQTPVDQVVLQPGVIQIGAPSAQASQTFGPDLEVQFLGTGASATPTNTSLYAATPLENGNYEVQLSSSVLSAPLAEGTILMLPASDQYPGGLALKVYTCAIDDTGSYYDLICTVPNIEEVCQSFEYNGGGVLKLDQIRSEDGVSIEYIPGSDAEENLDEADMMRAFDITESVKPPFVGTLKSTFVDKEIGNSGVKISGTAEFQMPAIQVRASGNTGFLGIGMRIDHCSIAILSEIDCKIALEYGVDFTEKQSESGKILLHTFPIALGASGFCVDVQVFLNLEAKGSASLTFELNSTQGVAYEGGAFRLIKDYDIDYEQVELNATLKIGPGIAVNLSLFSVFPLIGVDAHAGLALEGSYIPHIDVDPVLHCADGAVYLYATLEMNEDTIIIDIAKNHLRMPIWSWDIFDKTNSPLKANIHFENGQRVPECTYGVGDLLGVVKDVRTGEPIGGARVKIYRASDGREVASVITKSYVGGHDDLYMGEFLVEHLAAGTYRLDVQASQYKMYSILVEVLPDQRIICQAALMMLRENMTAPGVISGNVINALTGYSLSETTYEVRQGWNVHEGDTVASGSLSDGYYTLTLDPGHYTISISKDEFVTSHVNVTVVANENTTRNISVTPDGIGMDGSGFRVVLTWGATPSDLDSHLYKYDQYGNEGFHTWYSNKNYYQGGSLEANLDVDDTSSYGPETSTVYILDENAVYDFYVQDYSNRGNSSSTAMSNSDAQVMLYQGNSLIAVFNIQTNRAGTYWHVFRFDAATGQVIHVNELT